MVNKNFETAMGFDFGTRKIGMAIGQSITNTANPIDTIYSKDGVINWDEIRKIINQWQPDILVVGLPLNMDGSEQPITATAKKFANDLSIRFNLKVELVDERLTTKASKEYIFNEHGYKGLKKISVDSMSAKLILEQWMN